MVNKNVVRGFGIVLVIMSILWIVMAAVPTLTGGGVSPPSGNPSTSFVFSVTFTDASNHSADYVGLSLDGAPFPMVESDPNDTTTTDGKVFTLTKGSLSVGTHYYNFTAMNGSDQANLTGGSFTVSTVAPSIVSFLPSSSTVNSFVNDTQQFNVTLDQDASVSWKINGNEVQNLSTVSLISDYSNSSIGAGTYTVTAQAFNSNGTSSLKTWTWNVQVPNTPVGNDIVVTPHSNVRIIFSSVTSEGNTSVSAYGTPQFGDPSPPLPPLGNYYYISTSAVYSGDITVELTYSPGGVNESNTKLYHYSGGSWNDITLSHNFVDHKVTGNVTGFSPFVVAAPAAPKITKISPTGSSVETVGTASQTFKISVDQDANITWKLDTTTLNTTYALSSQEVNYTPSTLTPGSYTFSAEATNINGIGTATWNWTVRSKTYSTGNRVWDANKGMSTTYTWSPMSFYAFYYDVNDDVGNEILEIKLDSSTERTVRKNNLNYTTTPETVSFNYKGWGTYNVIGFMADKYFAAYTSGTSTVITGGYPVGTINNNQLHKILKDEKATHTVRASSTYPLSDGYAVTLKDVGIGREAMVSILKDNAEVYLDFASVNDTIVYSKRVGSVSDLPIIALHISNVFMGTTDNMIQIDGIFQISESYTSVNSGNNYGIMEVMYASDNGITMKNENSFTLYSGSTIDLMGDMKFIVAKSDTLRFAPMVKRSGEYEVRGTISNNETNNEWTPLNFEGFYYNLDEDVGTERLILNRSSDTSRTVNAEQIVYKTTASQVSHKYSSLGKYNVIGFMADKYFAGYLGGDGTITDTNISTIDRNQLHKVLIDDDTQRVIYAGSTLTLNDGYVIKIKDVNMGAGTPSVWLTVLKDGNEVYDDFKEKGQIFIYSKDVGAVRDLPVIALRIDSIFRGKEATAAFVRGTFQISESYTTVKSGDTFDKMKVESIGNGNIIMKNPNTITLDTGMTDTLMKNIKLKVADSPVIRFYPFIMVNGSALAANQLGITVPSSMMVKDTITISVTSGAGTPQDNAEVSFDGNVIGTTNSTGKLDYMLTRAGLHNITATKLGYEKAIKSIQIAEYVDNRLSLVLPEFIDQYIPVSIKVIVSGSGNAITGANITLDGASIGTTDSGGILTYTFTNSGKHNLAASRNGYITVQREIDIRMPFTEFKALDINFRPEVVAKGQNVYVWSNITNSGTKEGMLPVALIINNTVVENKNVTLAPGKNGEVNFSHRIDLPVGNYTVEILGQKTTMPVKDEPLNLFLVAGVVTGLGAITVYFLTSKNLMNIETVNQAVSKARENLESLTSKFTKGGGKGGSPPKFDPFTKFNK